MKTDETKFKSFPHRLETQLPGWTIKPIYGYHVACFPPVGATNSRNQLGAMAKIIAAKGQHFVVRPYRPADFC